MGMIIRLVIPIITSCIIVTVYDNIWSGVVFIAVYLGVLYTFFYNKWFEQ